MRTSIALALVLALAGAAPAAVAEDGPSQEEYFVAGGPHAVAEFPPDPATVVSEDRAVTAATCGVESPIPPPAIPPLHPALTGGVGGECFLVTDYDGDTQLSVTVQRLTASIPENRLHFAAGYDGDDDGCIGCSSADALWKGVGQLQVPVLQGEPSLVVFVYGLTADTDPTSGGAPLQTALAGTITVEPVGTGDDACEGQPSIPEAEPCGVAVEEPRPHLCVPSCVPLVD